ncbi:sulfite exporter TauE/SafE family protein [Oceanobacillus kimchii]|uniref:sulfite exporter TauE/SafE family protein n=1 Tax=Oceanobacillus kimchii TaxID=746691 RepID=UPI001FCBBCFB|nr:sulfite exporter TauE/SafE family protein [Oceanobacillus kimchii]
MEFDILLMITVFMIGFIGSLISGMIGIGGSIIKYPLLLYIPSMLGLTAFTAHEVSGISAVQVFFATIGGVSAYRNTGYLHRSLIGYMGVSVLIGSIIGSFGSSSFSEGIINIVYGLLAIIAAIMMFIPRKTVNAKSDQIQFNRVVASVLALIVGIGAGIVGAAGAFLLVPIMLTLLKIPMRVTIASSLAITFISSIGSTIGKISTGQVPLFPAVIMIISSLIAAPLGAKIGQKVNTSLLQWILAILITGTAIKIWTDIIFNL